MESLSTELCDEVASYLSTTDLRALRLVNRQFSAVATRPLFAVLRFGSHRQDKFYFNWGPYWEHQGYPGRIRTVEFGSVPEAVVDIMASSLEQHAKAFIFDPAYYRKDFWRDYRAWIKATVQNYWDEEHVSDEDFMSETEEDPPRSVQRQQWRTRIAREAPAVKRAHTVWGVKSLHQEASMDDIIDALTKMFKEMNCLYSLDVRSPMFRGYPGLDSFFSFDIDKSTLHNKPCNFPSSNYVNMLAMALRGAGRHISELRISLACVPELENNLSNAHLFTGLQQLELDMIEDDSFFTSSRRLESFCSLMLFAAPTLQSLALYHPMARPYMRERSLLKLLSIDANESPWAVSRYG
ncbi:hypothetical protein F5Y18DRAFT_389068 [Xylariaceae sp. FL1019]|nr:hypothetical protein F5Y18DRAFT_389068 [Xylariaceae sp. FL1019]